MPVNIIQISDTHIQSDPAATFDEVDTAASLTAVMTHIRQYERPDLMLLTGDLVHEPDNISYARLNQLLTPAQADIYAIPGNHDDPELMQATLSSPVRHERDLAVDHWRILLLNTWLEGEHAGHLPERELCWLEARLAEQPVINTLIALHHPPVSIGSSWMDAMGLRNADELLAILDQYSQVKCVIWGHIHQVFEAERDGMKLLSCPSTCVQFKPGSNSYAKDHRQPGYRRLVLLDNGDIETEVVRV